MSASWFQVTPPAFKPRKREKTEKQNVKHSLARLYKEEESKQAGQQYLEFAFYTYLKQKICFYWIEIDINYLKWIY